MDDTNDDDASSVFEMGYRRNGRNGVESKYFAPAHASQHPTKRQTLTSEL